MARRAAAAPVEEIEDDDSLELVEEEAEVKPATRRTVKKAPGSGTARTANEYGANWLATYVNDTLGTEYTAANVRVILRKMANEGVLEREVGTDRARYQFSGEGDRLVKAVLKRVREGQADTDKTERIAAARAGKKAAAPVEDIEDATPAPRKRATKAAAAPVEDAKPRATRRRASA